MGGIVGSSLWSGRRIAGPAGIGFVVLFVVLIALGFDSLVLDDPAADVREFFVNSDTQVRGAASRHRAPRTAQVVDALMEAGLKVVVVTSRSVKALRDKGPDPTPPRKTDISPSVP